MRNWNLTLNDPLELTLCNDARLGPTSYTNDQIWQLVCGIGEPPALAAQTTFGLRARSFRLFPIFILAERRISDPTIFYRPPVFHKLYPNFLLISFSPFEAIDVISEYWIPDCDSLACRLKITNTGNETVDLGVEWVALLSPNGGHRMAPLEIKAAQILHGKTNDLSPVVFTTGGSGTTVSPYPALISQHNLEPEKTLVLTLSQSSQSNGEDSFKKTQTIACRKWEAEIARIEMTNHSWLDIYTGDPDWDTAFYLAQKIACSFIHSPTPSLPGHSLILTRQPDFGYSLRGDGVDYGFLWNGQTPLDVYYLSGFLLPGAYEIIKDLLFNFVHIQNENGFIDLKPGLAGQRSRLLATPILAAIAWKLFHLDEDEKFLRKVYPHLLKFFETWFSDPHDRDTDGIPEWDHPTQMGFEEHPLFSYWFNWSQGVDITTTESPSLCSFLYNECQRLLQISAQINQLEKHQVFAITLERLTNKVNSMWSLAHQSYLYQDRDTHQSLSGEIIVQHFGPGLLEIQKKFPDPCRLSINLYCLGERTARPKISIHGIDSLGQNRDEQITYDHFRWHIGYGSLTGDFAYRQIDRIDIQDIQDDDNVIIRTIGYDFLDHTSLLPLWAGIPDQTQAEKLIQNTLTNPDSYWLPFGIPASPRPAENTANAGYKAVHMLYNSLIGEGLIRYGFREKAAELVRRLMPAVIHSLKEEKTFYQYYHAQTGQGFGERNTLNGLPPLGLFMDTLGIEILTSNRVKLQGINPYPWPVTVKYRGLSILRGKEKTVVTFPNGQSTTIEDPTPCTVALV